MTIPFASYPGNRINYAGFSLECFRPSLEGTTNWPAVMEVFDELGDNRYLTFDYFHPYGHYPKALICQTSDLLDRLLGKSL